MRRANDHYFTDRDRRWEVEELEMVAAADGHGDIIELARKLGRSIDAVRQKRAKLTVGRAMRRACPAFLPDDGVPYCVRAKRVLRDAPK